MLTPHETTAGKGGIFPAPIPYSAHIQKQPASSGPVAANATMVLSFKPAEEVAGAVLSDITGHYLLTVQKVGTTVRVWRQGTELAPYTGLVGATYAEFLSNILHAYCGTDKGRYARLVVIDGTALTHTQFWEPSAKISGLWVAKPLGRLPYGPNGVRLDFKDAADLGRDSKLDAFILSEEAPDPTFEHDGEAGGWDLANREVRVTIEGGNAKWSGASNYAPIQIYRPDAAKGDRYLFKVVIDSISTGRLRAFSWPNYEEGDTGNYQWLPAAPGTYYAVIETDGLPSSIGLQNEYACDAVVSECSISRLDVGHAENLVPDPDFTDASQWVRGGVNKVSIADGVADFGPSDIWATLKPNAPLNYPDGTQILTRTVVDSITKGVIYSYTAPDEGDQGHAGQYITAPGTYYDLIEADEISSVFGLQNHHTDDGSDAVVSHFSAYPVDAFKGENIAPDPTFDQGNDGGWARSNFTVDLSSGQAVWTNAATWAGLKRHGTYRDGEKYLVTVEVTALTIGALRVFAFANDSTDVPGTGETHMGPLITTPGTYSYVVDTDDITEQIGVQSIGDVTNATVSRLDIFRWDENRPTTLNPWGTTDHEFAPECLSITATSAADGWGPEKVLDRGLLNDHWRAERFVLAATLTLNYGRNHTVHKYALRAGNYAGDLIYPAAWRLEGSTDGGTTWKVLDTVSGESGWVNDETREYVVDTVTPCADFRLVITANCGNTNWVGLGELYLYDSVNLVADQSLDTPTRNYAVRLPDGQGSMQPDTGKWAIFGKADDLCSGGVATGAPIFGADPAYVPGKAFDGDTTTYYYCATVDGWLAYDFGTPRLFNRVSLLGYNTSLSPRNCTISGSNDGVVWTDLLTGWDPGDYTGEPSVAVFENTVKYSRIRLSWTTSDNGTRSAIRAMNAWHFGVNVFDLDAGDILQTSFKAEGLDFGADGTWQPPAGYAHLCTASLPDPDIFRSTPYVDLLSRVGTGDTTTVSGLGFKPDLINTKNRDVVSRNWVLTDSVRGAGRQLATNLSNAETTAAGSYHDAITEDGFSVGWSVHTNEANQNFVDLCLKAGRRQGFNIVRWTGTADSVLDLNTGLNKPVTFALFKRVDNTLDWLVFHRALSAGENLKLDTAVADTGNRYWPEGHNLTGSFRVWGALNTQGGEYVAYLFTDSDIFRTFAYTGNGTDNGPDVPLGGKVLALPFLKNADAVQGWVNTDSVRNPLNPVQQYLMTNTNEAENTAANLFRYSSTGFRPTRSFININGTENRIIGLAVLESAKYANAF